MLRSLSSNARGFFETDVIFSPSTLRCQIVGKTGLHAERLIGLIHRNRARAVSIHANTNHLIATKAGDRCLCFSQGVIDHGF